MLHNATLKDISKILNLSISTVSKALNDSNEISSITKQRVIEIAEQLNYKPNYIAKCLRYRKTNTIGVIIPDILNYYFVKVLSGIEKEARINNYKVITCISNEQYQTEIDNIKILANGAVDGLIISLSIETQQKKDFSHIKDLIKNKIPIILFDRVSNEIECPKITSDDLIAAYNATKFLMESGSKHPALITTNLDLSVVKLRNTGYIQAINEFSVLDEKHILSLETINDSEQLIEKFLMTNPLIDSVFSVDERLAIKTLKVAKRLGYDIPNKFKIIGFSNGELSEEYFPALSVVELYPEKIGLTATQSMINCIEDYDKNCHKLSITVKSELILRETTI